MTILIILFALAFLPHIIVSILFIISIPINIFGLGVWGLYEAIVLLIRIYNKIIAELSYLYKRTKQWLLNLAHAHEKD
tara:strand:+ start:562 stop:795 length:234 start_codon:yes stop_codon:yes gene_type:complete